MKTLLPYLLLLFCFAGCSRNKETGINKNFPQAKFVEYTIDKGAHYCRGNEFKPLDLPEMKFIVRFDSTAIYENSFPENQYDINKLFGFSDNGATHHEYSARFGWRWSEGALRLFAYVYNEGMLSSAEIGIIPIGAEISCSIKPLASKYIFTVEGNVMEMPRKSSTVNAKGYQLYPYFGGDELAPHQINIWIETVE